MPWWSWIVLGAVLLISEIFVSTDFYLVFFAASALLVGLLGALGVPLTVAMQWTLFAALSVVALLLFRSRLRRSIRTAEDEVDNLTGQVAEATDSLPAGGTGHVKLRGSVWQALNAGDTEIRSGDSCRVENVDGLVLSVRRAS